MTADKARKRAIRARTARTGEAYNAAARALDHERQANAEPAVPTSLAGPARDGRLWVSSWDGNPRARRQPGVRPLPARTVRRVRGLPHL
ncbi:hypothetical protein [Nonomuraea sp. GTA35]|uniref:hypothetical protein n=1 Tax=Nonomuraea sp. GTA35 TaxID=1676746 RepID=UPI0035C0C577